MGVGPIRRPLHLKGILFALALLGGLLPAGSQAQTAPPACQFVLGFATLHGLVPGEVGDCVDNQSYAANGDAQQHTTKGLMAWRKADNWTAFTNGYMTWINGPNGLVSRLNTDRFPWEAVAPAVTTNAIPAATPTPSPAATPTPSPTVKPLYAWFFKRPSEPPTLCGSGQAFACIDSAPNLGSQYISGHVLDKNGQPVYGMVVDGKTNGVDHFAWTGSDGLFNILIATTCPQGAITYQVYVVDGGFKLSSYVKTITYTDCHVAGEFHVDFVQVS